MKRTTVLLLIVSFLLVGIMPALAENNTEQTHSIVEDFDTSRLHGSWRNMYARNNLEKTSGFFGQAGLKVKIPRGSHFGSEFSYDLEPNVEELYFRYLLRFDENWNTYGSGGKIPGPAGIYGNTGLGCKPSTVANPGWSARMRWFPVYENPESAASTQIGYYTYHLDQPNDCGEGMKWDAKLKHGRWYCIEGHIKLNEPGKRNGVLRGWINGRNVFSKKDIAFRREGEGHMDIKNFWFNVYFGGKQTPEENQQLSLDRVVLSSSRAGCPVSMLPDWREAMTRRLTQLALI